MKISCRHDKGKPGHKGPLLSLGHCSLARGDTQMVSTKAHADLSSPLSFTFQNHVRTDFFLKKSNKRCINIPLCPIPCLKSKAPCESSGYYLCNTQGTTVDISHNLLFLVLITVILLAHFPNSPAQIP